MTTALLLISICTFAVAEQIDAQRWAQAEREIRRIAPQAYPGLPRYVSRYLLRHGYTIPQSYDSEALHNAVRGRLNNDSTPEWAVLASRRGHSEILIFWGGSASRVTKINRRLDSDYLQGIGGDEIGYSRSISIVGRDYILEHYRRYSGPKPPPIRHDAIDDGFSGKSSAVYYFDDRRWHALQGAE